MGLFVCNGIPKGEVVWAERKAAGAQVAPVPRSRAWIEALPPASKKAYCHFMYKTGEDEYQSLAEFNDMPTDEYPSVRPVDVSNYMNHSCNPSCWFVDGGEEYTGLMVAARDLLPGDEITFDYNTTEYDMAAPFPCWETGSMVRGYAHLSASERGPIAKFVAPHVLRLAEQETGEDCSPHLLRRAEDDASLKVEAA